MPTALRDMPAWRRAIIEAGLTYAVIAEATGKSVHAIQAYAGGRRTPTPEWERQVEALARQALDGPAEATA